ncbi:Asp23/Gls24 family envelope stress response protein [Solicola sp. PLA-1-18]|uniref:Asp23/Gls24 family envelope stress response protein n=1 Tax=Solicola sp. PLA-1-18 TaxID=3380532 RepID=UPI003B7CEBC6
MSSDTPGRPGGDQADVVPDPTADDPVVPDLIVTAPADEPVELTTDAEVEASEEAVAEPDDPADVVARAVLSTPGVADLHGGVLGEVATYLPGRRVNGVRLHDGGADIHVVVAWGSSVRETADAVRSTVRSHVDGPVDVTVEDVARPA